VVIGARADSKTALGAARTVESKAASLQALTRDFVAESSRAPRDFLFFTWQKFHEEWYGEVDEETGEIVCMVPVLPLTRDKMLAVSSMFKAGRYKSFANYLARMKDAHQEICEWTSMLDRVRKRCERSVLRGLGGPKRKEGIPVERVGTLERRWEPVAEGGPVDPVRFFLHGCLFGCRGIEMSLALFEEGTLDLAARTTGFWLPVSKTDPRAI
jgi:hypothetical protein